MKILIRKELISIFYSGTGLIFSFIFLIACGLMLWVFPGSFNIPDSGYTTAEKFFTLAPILLIILIPALTMRLVAEEKKNNTIILLRSRPLWFTSILLSKWIASLFFVILVILSTSTYIYTLYTAGNPIGNIDLQVTAISYLSLISLAGVFVAIGIFSSCLSKNQIVAFAIALFLNFLAYFGFNLISELFTKGSTQITIASYGLSSHFDQMQRGVISFNDISVFLIYLFIFFILSLYILNPKKKQELKTVYTGIISIIALIVLNLPLSSFRFDLTKDKRYTIDQYTQRLMKMIKDDKTSNIKIDVFLEGNLNSGFQRLQNSTRELLSELNRYAGHKLEISFTNPSTLPVSRENLPEYMDGLGMQGILLNELDRDGKLSQQIIYPYALVATDSDTLRISLLKNIAGNTAEENLNFSSENLEFKFVDALRLLTQNEVQDIAFIEGHSELPRTYVYDAEEALAKYFNVNRGEIGNNISVLDNFKVIIIAGAKNKFTESEKYILDQYLMKGGRILFLQDGAIVAEDDLGYNGQATSIKNDAGLDDLLFNYDVRINADLLQDSQCTSIMVNSGENSQTTAIPYYYSPLLLPSPNNVVTKNMADVKSELISSINVLNNVPSIKKEVLLTTSAHSRIIPVPEIINFDIRTIQSTPDYFNSSYIPVAVSLEGSFRSAFINRPIPLDIENTDYQTITESKHSKIIVVSSSDVIRNQIVGQGKNTQIIPMGYDPIANKLYGNRDFIVNAVNWLADSDQLQLKMKKRQMNLLDKQLIYENRNIYAVANTLIPILCICIIVLGVNVRRKMKYD